MKAILSYFCYMLRIKITYIIDYACMLFLNDFIAFLEQSLEQILFYLKMRSVFILLVCFNWAAINVKTK